VSPQPDPAKKVTKADIQAKLSEIRGDVEETAEGARSTITMVAVGVAVVVVVAAFMLGRARGRRKSTVVEIRRR
jgi:6-phosphogluconate dehydrogenase (decarboxylating)